MRRAQETSSSEPTLGRLRTSPCFSRSLTTHSAAQSDTPIVREMSGVISPRFYLGNLIAYIKVDRQKTPGDLYVSLKSCW